MNQVQLTKDGLKKIQDELTELKNIKRPVAIERLSKARSMGDLSENSEYSAAKEELSFIEGRIQELEELLKNAQVIEVNNNNNSIQIGNIITVQVNNENRQLQIVGEFEADPLNNKISNTSPIGQALIGKKIGDQVEVNVPAGKIIYKIIDIKK